MLCYPILYAATREQIPALVALDRPLEEKIGENGPDGGERPYEKEPGKFQVPHDFDRKTSDGERRDPEEKNEPQEPRVERGRIERGGEENLKCIIGDLACIRHQESEKRHAERDIHEYERGGNRQRNQEHDLKEGRVGCYEINNEEYDAVDHVAKCRCFYFRGENPQVKITRRQEEGIKCPKIDGLRQCPRPMKKTESDAVHKRDETLQRHGLFHRPAVDFSQRAEEKHPDRKKRGIIDHHADYLKQKRSAQRRFIGDVSRRWLGIGSRHYRVLVENLQQHISTRGAKAILAYRGASVIADRLYYLDIHNDPGCEGSGKGYEVSK